nr:type II toxin-antitoxin system YoeB family toxin [uncultured Clostridium sp.]
MGKPEPLKGYMQRYWSGRIDEANPQVYRINGGKIEIIQYRTHYQNLS